MANKMLIDATHPEETRVVVLRGNRVEEFDFESAHRKQLRGNIYLAKVTRVEPSLQAAFVDYGGNRHGFLAFSEIHPDYYQIPVADRQALLDEENRAHHDEDDNADRGSDRGRGRGRHRHKRRGAERHRGRDIVRSDNLGNEAREAAEIPPGDTPLEDLSNEPRGETDVAPGIDIVPAQDAFAEGASDQPISGEAPQSGIVEAGEGEFSAEGNADQAERTDRAAPDGENGDGAEDVIEEEIVESVGGDAMEEVRDRAPRYRRQYKIQEVIKRRQVMLVQVVKEERGTKGAALTTYLSLAGRYSVLMPNTARGGGISRKVTNSEDRKKMKEVAEELEVPEGMGVILRTAGANRTKLEVKRDFEYLLRLWETVRDLTLKSTAPTLVYEEGSLVKRSIRDLYHKDIDDIVVEGDDAYREAKDFMRMLMPSHAKNVHAYKDPQPLFARYGIETQLDGMFSATVQLKSGGYIVLNQAEALVAIDVNSGRATREHSIEETALKTNSEAAAEVARQLRLRDLAGLIVIDFIDMDENRNNRSVERKLKEALKSDRARIQVGRISHFGLLEMSRQRIRSSVLESSTETCPHCGGTGHVRSVSSVALQLLRSLEETLLKGATHNLIVRTRSDVAIYVLNNKRAHLRLLEERFRIAITITTDPTLTGIPAFAVDRGDQVMTLEQAKAIAATRPDSLPVYTENEDDEVPEDVEADGEADAELPVAAEPQTQGEQQDARGKRRRRGRRGRGRGREDREGLPQEAAPHTMAPAEEFEGSQSGEVESGEVESADGELEGAPGEPGQARETREESEKRRRRRGRRGGRRNRRGREGNGDATNAPYERDGADDIAASPPQGHYDEGPRDIVDTTPAPRIEPRAVEAPVSKPAEVAAPGAPRRRSTIREPAPSFDAGSDAPRPTPPSAPPPAPNVQSSADDADKPRRGGWWSRRG